MQKQPKISIIIPVYNTSKYLKKCLDSVINQTYKNYNVIIVNDGSTDNSLDIIKEYMKKSSSIILINQKNMGLSIARNNAVKKVESDYFLFLDSDDYLDINALKILSENLDNEDLLRYQLRDVKEDSYIDREYITFKNLSGKDAIRKLIDSYYTEPACSYLYKTKFYKENNFQFQEKMYHEDYGLIPYVIIKADKVSAIGDKIYFYLQREGSITKNKNIILKRYQDVKKQYDTLLEKLNKEDFENKKYLISYLTNALFYKLVLLDDDNYKKEIKILRKEDIFSNLLNDTLKRKIKNIILKINPRLIIKR